jgi:predicted ATPase/DNA-binding SARP family transcriptional activator
MEHPIPASQIGLTAQLLGQIRISVNGSTIPDDAWPRRTSRLLLLLLLTSPGHRLHRDTVIDALWPDVPPDAATKSLYVTVHGLRRVLEPRVTSGRASRFIDVTSDAIRLEPDSIAWIDVDRFEAELDASDGARRERLANALSLYAGDLLSEEPYLDWSTSRREHLRWRWREAVLEFALLERQAGRPMLAVPALERVVQSDPTDEAAFRAIMSAYAEAGRRNDALRQFERCVTHLEQDLGVLPSEETLSLATAIREIRVAPPDLAIPSGRIDILPAPPNPLIGRGRELEEVFDLLSASDVRLVTITGPGGVGKTRLAMEAAALSRDEFADGVCFVSLAHIRNAGLVAPEIARTLGIDDSGSEPAIALLQRRIGSAHFLMVLDNLEQVLEAAPDLADLLAQCSHLVLLATSREPLHLRSEHDFPLGPLPAPRSSRQASTLSRYPAVELFVQRARAVRHGFALTDENAQSVGQLCERLDGFPLAIELAAARVRHLEPQDLVEGLNDRFALLANGFIDLPPRQRTMRAAIGWSYDLLNEVEQLLFRWLSIFAGGFDATSASRIAPEGIKAAPVLLSSLVDKGLVHIESSAGQQRYGMFETIREFALEMLKAAGEEEVAAQRLSDWAVDLAELAEPELTGPDQAEWYERLDLELANLRASFHHLLQDPSGYDTALRLAAAPWRFFWSRGNAREGRDWLRRILSRTTTLANASRARALYAAAELAQALGEDEDATALCEEGLAIRTALHDHAGTAEILNALGLLARSRGELERAETLHREALALMERAGYRRGVASSLNYLGAVSYYRGEITECDHYWSQALAMARELNDHRSVIMMVSNLGALAIMQQDAARAISLHEEGLALARRLGDTHGITQGLANLAGALVEHGDHERAAGMFEEALVRVREAGDLPTEAIILFNLGQLAEIWSDPVMAASRYRASLVIFRDTNNLPGVAASLEQAGMLAADQDAFDLGVRTMGAAAAIREVTGATRDAVDHGEYSGKVESIRSRMGEAVFADAWSTAMHLPTDDVIGEALAFLDRFTLPAKHQPSSP